MRFLLTLALVLSLSSSALAQCQPDHVDRPLLVGQWNWLYTYDVHSGDSTPGSLGVTRVLELRDDGTYDLLEDGLSIEAGSWCLRPCEFNIQDNCTDSRVVLYLEFAFPFPEWNYGFCEATSCTYFIEDLTVGLRIEALDHSNVIKLHEPVSTVPSRPLSWSTLKAHH